MHTPLCGHAQGAPQEYGRAALRRGLAGITVTCHNPLPDGLGAHIRMAESDWPHYLELVQQAREDLAPEIEVRLGLEADFLSGLEPYLEKQLLSAPFDYVLGSVHWHMPDWQHRFWRGRSLEALYRVYFEELARAAESGLFDCLAHPDLVKNASPKTWDFASVSGLVARTLDRIAATGVAMELNTSGRRKPSGEFYPSQAMLAMMAERGIPVVLGADAHQPERVAEGFEEALDLLETAGYRCLTVFRQRAPLRLDLARARASLRTAPT